MKALLKKVIPAWLLERRQRHVLERMRRSNADRPIAEVFSDIYGRQLWGHSSDGFHSGSGSMAAAAQPYALFVQGFIRANGIKTVLDVGCGDYRVGALLRVDGVRYIGVDIVASVIARNQAAYGDASTTFLCRNALEDELPPADLCLVRQVLQHLSNNQIESLLRRVDTFQHVLVTEHLPPPGALVTPNVDKPHGADTRLDDGSGVYLELPPFRRSLETVLETKLDPGMGEGSAVLRTTLLRPPQARQRR